MTALIRTEGEEGKGINQADFTVARFEGTNKFYQCSKCLMCPDTCSSLCFKKFPLFEISLPDAFPYPNWKFGSAPCVVFRALLGGAHDHRRQPCKPGRRKLSFGSESAEPRNLPFHSCV